MLRDSEELIGITLTMRQDLVQPFGPLFSETDLKNISESFGFVVRYASDNNPIVIGEIPNKEYDNLGAWLKAHHEKGISLGYFG